MSPLHVPPATPAALDAAIDAIVPDIRTAAQFGSANPVLPAGRLGVESDTGVTKLGDGVTVYADLNPTDIRGMRLQRLAITALSAAFTTLDDVTGLTGLIVPDYPFPTEVRFKGYVYNTTSNSGTVVALVKGTATFKDSGKHYQSPAGTAGFNAGDDMKLMCGVAEHEGGTYKVACARMNPPNTGASHVYADADNPAVLSLYAV